MLELSTMLTQADGSQRVITIRIGDVSETHGGTANPWSAAVEILGFAKAEATRLRGRDWAEAIEDAARFAALRVADKVEAAGGGTLDPPFFPRPRTPASTGAACRIADDEPE
ncbi:hypothetical protein WMF31_08755 [Sorangium sp. So ce1036]|uniref:hypothetical protein n=1 Tax=Sorangium sp. So ce1036 TaxID=3133328 RepID=UPI003EFCEB39